MNNDFVNNNCKHVNTVVGARIIYMCAADFCACLLIVQDSLIHVGISSMKHAEILSLASDDNN